MTYTVLILYSIILLNLCCAIWMPAHIYTQVQVHTILKSIRLTTKPSYSARLYFVQEGNMSLLLSTSFVFPMCLLLQ